MSFNTPRFGPSTISTDRMIILFTVMLVAAAGNTAMQSILPSIGTELGVPDVWVAMAFSWSAVLWVLTAPYWARLSDRRGRRTLMALGMIGFAASMGFCGAALFGGLHGWISAGTTFILFAIFRSLYGGFGSAAPPAVQAYIAARTEAEERSKAMSLLSSSFGLGTVIGPALAPYLIFPVLGLSGPLISFAVIGVAVLVCLRIILPDDTPRFDARGVVANYPGGGGGSATPGGASDADDLRDEDLSDAPTKPAPPLSWRDRRLRPWIYAGLMGGHAQAVLIGVVGFYTLDRLGLRQSPAEGAQDLGIIMMSGAGATLLAQWGIIPALNPSPRNNVIWGGVIAALGIWMVASAGTLHGIMMGYAVASLGFGLYRPGFTAGSSLAVRRSEQGAVAGMVASINGAAYIIAPAIGVWIYNHHGWWLFAGLIALCLMLAGWTRAALSRG